MIVVGYKTTTAPSISPSFRGLEWSARPCYIARSSRPFPSSTFFSTEFAILAIKLAPCASHTLAMEINPQNLPPVTATKAVLAEWWAARSDLDNPDHVNDRRALVVSSLNLIVSGRLVLSAAELSTAVEFLEDHLSACQRDATLAPPNTTGTRMTYLTNQITLATEAIAKLKSFKAQSLQAASKSALDQMTKLPYYYTGPGNETADLSSTNANQQIADPSKYIARMVQMAQLAQESLVKYLRAQAPYHALGISKLCAELPWEAKAAHVTLEFVKLVAPDQVALKVSEFVTVALTKADNVRSWCERLVATVQFLPQGTTNTLVKAHAFAVVQAYFPQHCKSTMIDAIFDASTTVQALLAPLDSHLFGAAFPAALSRTIACPFPHDEIKVVEAPARVKSNGSRDAALSNNNRSNGDPRDSCNGGQHANQRDARGRFNKNHDPPQWIVQ